MKLLSLKVYRTFYINQLRLKFIKTNIYYNIFIKSLDLTMVYNKLESIKVPILLESFFYFKLISNKKPYISYFKKKYKEVDIAIKLNILKKNSDFFFLLFSSFFLPMILKKDGLFKFSFLNSKNLTLSLNSYSFYPFIPNIYFSWVKKFVIQWVFTSTKLKENNLVLVYYKIKL